jgi:hypothetical protein
MEYSVFAEKIVPNVDTQLRESILWWRVEVKEQLVLRREAGCPCFGLNGISPVSDRRMRIVAGVGGRGQVL